MFKVVLSLLAFFAHLVLAKGTPPDTIALIYPSDDGILGKRLHVVLQLSVILLTVSLSTRSKHDDWSVTIDSKCLWSGMERFHICHTTKWDV